MKSDAVYVVYAFLCTKCISALYIKGMRVFFFFASFENAYFNILSQHIFEVFCVLSFLLGVQQQAPAIQALVELRHEGGGNKRNSLRSETQIVQEMGLKR